MIRESLVEKPFRTKLDIFLGFFIEIKTLREVPSLFNIVNIGFLFVQHCQCLTLARFSVWAAASVRMSLFSFGNLRMVVMVMMLMVRMVMMVMMVMMVRMKGMTRINLSSLPARLAASISPVA